ncbi:MAG: DUF4956 domain-containing protein [Candidatus Cryptobacteroides sp.]
MLNILQSAIASLDESELIGIQSIADPTMTNAQNLTELTIRFLLNLLSCWIIVRLLYYPGSRRRDYLFTFTAFSSAMLLLLYIMGRVDVGVGLTLGLFAIFGIIRYRTETVPIREMTYLFVIIALAAVNGLAPLYSIDGTGGGYFLNFGDLALAAAANIITILLILALEKIRPSRSDSSKIILYDRLDLIAPEKKGELLADIEKRCGVKAVDVEIGNIDLLKDAAYIKVLYKDDGAHTIGHIIREKQFVESQNL